METVGVRLRRIRRERNMTQETLANLLGVERVTISRYENNVYVPKAEHLHELSEVLGYPVRYLLCKTNDPSDDRNASPKAAGSDARSSSPGQGREGEEDPGIRQIARARKDMTPAERSRMMKILKASFEEYFKGDAD